MAKVGQEKGRTREKTATDFKEAVCCPSAVVQGQHGEKMVCVREMPRVTGTLRKANNHFDPIQVKSGSRGPHHRVEAAIAISIKKA